MKRFVCTRKTKIILWFILRPRLFVTTIIGNTPAKPMQFDSSLSMLKLSGFSFSYPPKNANRSAISSTPAIVRGAL